MVVFVFVRLNALAQVPYAIWVFQHIAVFWGIS